MTFLVYMSILRWITYVKFGSVAKSNQRRHCACPESGGEETAHSGCGKACVSAVRVQAGDNERPRRSGRNFETRPLPGVSEQGEAVCRAGSAGCAGAGRRPEATTAGGRGAGRQVEVGI